MPPKVPSAALLLSSKVGIHNANFCPNSTMHINQRLWRWKKNTITIFDNDTLRTLGCSKILPRTPLLFCQARISVCIQSATRIWNCSVYGLRKTRAERVNFFKAINTAISNSSCWLDTDTYSARENNGVRGSILLLPKVRIILFRFLPAFQTKLFKLFRIGPFH